MKFVLLVLLRLAIAATITMYPLITTAHVVPPVIDASGQGLQLGSGPTNIPLVENSTAESGIGTSNPLDSLVHYENFNETKSQTPQFPDEDYTDTDWSTATSEEDDDDGIQEDDESYNKIQQHKRDSGEGEMNSTRDRLLRNSFTRQTSPFDICFRRNAFSTNNIQVSHFPIECFIKILRANQLAKAQQQNVFDLSAPSPPTFYGDQENGNGERAHEVDDDGTQIKHRRRPDIDADETSLEGSFPLDSNSNFNKIAALMGNYIGDEKSQRVPKTARTRIFIRKSFSLYLTNKNAAPSENDNDEEAIEPRNEARDDITEADDHEQDNSVHEDEAEDKDDVARWISLDLDLWSLLIILFLVTVFTAGRVYEFWRLTRIGLEAMEYRCVHRI